MLVATMATKRRRFRPIVKPIFLKLLDFGTLYCGGAGGGGTKFLFFLGFHLFWHLF